MRRKLAAAAAGEPEGVVWLAGFCLAWMLVLLPFVTLPGASADGVKATAAPAPIQMAAVSTIEVGGFAFHNEPAMSPWPYAKAEELPLCLRLHAALPLDPGPLVVIFVNRVEDAPNTALPSPDIISFTANTVFVNGNRSFVRLTNTPPTAAKSMALLCRNILGMEQAGELFSFELVECGLNGFKQVSIVFDFRPPL